MELRILQFLQRLVFESQLLRCEKKGVAELMARLFGKGYLGTLEQGLSSSRVFMLQQYVKFHSCMMSCQELYLPDEAKKALTLKTISAYMAALQKRSSPPEMCALLKGLQWVFEFYRPDSMREVL